MAAWLAPLLVCTTPLWAQSGAPRYKALDIAEPLALQLKADPRFDASNSRTVEFVMALAPRQQDLPEVEDIDEASLCIAQHGSGRDINWKLMVETTATTDILRFGRPDGPQVTVQMPLRGTGYHHFMFVTAGGRSQAIVDGHLIGELSDDGASPQPGVPLAPLSALPSGRTLTFGCEDGPTARAWVSTFRLWDTVLIPEDAALLRKRPGPVTDIPHLSEHLLSYSMFLETSKSVRLTGERIFFTRFKGAPGGTPFFLKRPRGQELFAVYYLTGTPRMSGLAVEYDAPTRFDQRLTKGETWTSRTRPVVLPSVTNVAAAERAAWIERRMRAQARFEDVVRIGTSAADDFEFLSKLLDRYRDAERTAIDSALDFADLTRFFIPLSLRQRFNGAICTLAVDGILGCQWTTDGTARAPLIETDNARVGVFSLQIPKQGRIEGIAGRRAEDGTILSLALAFSRAPQGDAMREQGLALSDGVWVARDFKKPERAPGPVDGTEQEAMSGDYSNQPVFRFRSQAQGRKLTLYVDTPTMEITGRPEPDRSKVALIASYTFAHVKGNWWAYQGGSAAEFDSMWVGRDTIRLGHSNDSAAGGIYLERPLPYATAAGPDKLSWGATFSLDHRPNGVQASFMGYHPARMRARDYQATTGADKPVIAMPAEASKDYTTNGSRVIVPHGLIFSLDSKGSERMDTQKVDTSMERQSSWTIGLGGSVGIPLVASFKVDGSHQQSQETVNSSEVSMATNRSVVTHYGLVLDKARARLDPEFRAAVIDLRNRSAAKMPVDWDGFFDIFGTHYPYAVTYGGLAWSETTIKSSETSILRSSDDKVSASGSGILDEMLEVGVSANGEYSQGSKSTEGSLRDRTNFGTYGGSFSKGGGWSMGRGEELPTLLDLRPIPELLSPVFFDDPHIFITLREEMRIAFATHFADIAAAMKVDHPWASGFDVRTKFKLPFSECFDIGEALSTCVRVHSNGAEIQSSEEVDGSQVGEVVSIDMPPPLSGIADCLTRSKKTRTCYTMSAEHIEVTTELLFGDRERVVKRFEFER